ncbi:MAG TPA: hypothetical protein VGE27_07520 [Gemmatimonas sp.]|uniref:hypothetical protein n=1 Tax=Gemmatimonas sp. TaxID=1962908 RepID=UPI002EDA4CB3
MCRNRNAPFVVLLFVLTACDRTPARITTTATDSDTVVVNSQRPTPLPATILTRNGSVLEDAPVQWRLVAGSGIALSHRGEVDCQTTADLRVEARSGAASRVFSVLCRPIAMVQAMPSVDLRLGDGPTDYSIGALTAKRIPVRQIAGVVAMADTSVAVLRDGRIVARAIGHTYLRVQAGDCDVAVGVRVQDPVDTPDAIAPYRPYETEFTLAPNEVRSWRPPAGLTLVHLLSEPATAPNISSPMKFGVLFANCANFRQTYRALSCVMTDSSVVAVRNTRTTSSPVRLRLDAMPQTPGSPKPKRVPSESHGNKLCPHYLG